MKTAEENKESYYLITLTNGEQYRAWGIGIGVDSVKGKIVSDRTMVDFYDKLCTYHKFYPIEEVESIIQQPEGTPSLIFEAHKKRKP